MTIGKMQNAPTAALIALGILLGGCSQTKVPVTISARLEGLKEEVQSGKSTLLATTDALQRLRDAKDAGIKPGYDTYAAALERLDAKSGGVGWVADMTASETQKFFKYWDEQIALIEDEEIREYGVERRQQSLDECAKLKAMDADLRIVFKPYMSRLWEIQRTLAADQTPQALERVRPSIDQAIAGQKEIVQRVDAIVKQINAMSSL
jgi:outer membrane murein-binding lipoprotein Lpp